VLGGYYGWTFPHRFIILSMAVAVAAENECILTGDPSRLHWIREQTKMVMSHGRKIDGTLYVPYKYTDDDWSSSTVLYMITS